MPKPQLITALDLGSQEVKIAVAQNREEGRIPEILAVEKDTSAGMRKGVITDVDKVAKKIAKLLQRVEAITNKKIKEVTCNISGSHLFVASSRGVVAVSRADQQISQEDIDRVISAAQAFSLPSNKEILDVVPKEFIVDGEEGIKDPLEMKGVRLETEILAICGFSPHLKNLTSALSLANLDILGIIPSALASGRAVLNPRQKELGVAVLDIGAWTTDMAVFEEGDLIHLAIFPIGSGHITNDIAIGFQTDIDTAERVKIEFGDCIYQRKGKPEKIEIFPSEDYGAEIPVTFERGKSGKLSKEKSEEKKKEALAFSRKFLIQIIEARVIEIFEECQKELKKISKNKLLPAGIVLTGGGAKLLNIDNLAKKEFKLPSQIGFPKGIAGLGKDTALSTICGLLLESVDFEIENSFTSPGLFSKIKRIFRVFMP